MTKNVKRTLICVFGILLLGVVGYYAYKYFPLFMSFFKEESRDKLVEYIQDKGFIGVLYFIGLQIVQVVVSFIPGEVTEVTGGIIYGAWLGYFYCAIGVLAGSILMYYVVKFFGRKSITKVLHSEKFAKYKFLHDEEKIELVVFILFFIPGTPKDLFTWIGPFIPIKASKFFFISTVARIPSILSSTFAGASLQSGNLWLSIVVFIVIGITGILGILYNKKFIQKRNEILEKKKRGQE